MRRKRREKKGKKAQFQVQFNWIFVLVVGAIILMFFFAVINKQKEVSRKKVARTLLTDIEAIATGAGVSTGTAQVIDVPNILTKMSCTEDCSCTYTIEDVNKQFKDKIIFAPGSMQSSEFLMWSLDWKTPFRATNFLYMTNKRIKYYFVYDSQDPLSLQVKELLERDLPAVVNAVFFDKAIEEVRTIKNKKFPKTVFVFLNTEPTNVLGNGFDSSFRKADVNLIVVDTTGESLTYYEPVGSSKKSLFSASQVESKEVPYVGLSLLWGGIFAEDKNMYECMMKAGFKKLSYVSSVYEKRAIVLNDAAMPGCSYGELYLESEGNAALSKYVELGINLSNEITQEDVDAVKGFRNELRQKNRALLLETCPRIY